MRALAVAVAQPGGDGEAEFVGAVPAPQPDQLLLERADETFDDGVAGRSADGREGVQQVPVPAELVAVGTGVLRPVVGADLDAVGDIVGRTERRDELGLERGQYGRAVLPAAAPRPCSGLAALARSLLPTWPLPRVRLPAAASMKQSVFFVGLVSRRSFFYPHQGPISRSGCTFARIKGRFPGPHVHLHKFRADFQVRKVYFRRGTLYMASELRQSGEDPRSCVAAGHPTRRQRSRTARPSTVVAACFHADRNDNATNRNSGEAVGGLHNGRVRNG